MLYNLDFLANGQPWPPAAESNRIRAYLENANLREGDFEAVWPDLKDYLRKGKHAKDFEFTLDYPSLITTKTSDLIIGEPPTFCLPSVGDKRNPAESQISDLADRVNFLETLDAFITNLDSLGDAVLKISLTPEKEAKIANVDPSNWFPVVKRGTDEVLYHVLGFKYKDGEVAFLEVEIHGKTETGKHVIEHRLYSLNENVTVTSADTSLTNSVIGDRLEWQGEVPEIEENPLSDFLIFTASQKSDGVFGKSSYSRSLKFILKKLIVRYALAHDVLDVFSRPTFFGPREFQDLDPVTKKPVFKPGGYIAINPDPHTTPVLPAGLTWDAHLAENEAAIASLMNRLFDVSEMSPVLFAGNLVGMAESGTALRLRLTNTLAKCNRIKRKLEGAAKKAINAALALEGNPLEGLYIEWGSNLPRLPLEEAQRFQLLSMTPQFAGEVGGQFLLRELGYSEEEAAKIMMDSSRNSGMGVGI